MKRSRIEQDNEQISIRRQCKLLGVNRATLYYQAEPASDEDIRMMRLIDEIYTCCPFYASHRITAQLNRDEERIGISSHKVKVY